MAKRMLIDATHPEETRVVVLNGNRLEEFDFESSTKKQVKGNIYLAKVTRVEPSLQAAFVDYGGNRHGFLAFSEIHPDYYRIPVGDRQAATPSRPPTSRRASERRRRRRTCRSPRRCPSRSRYAGRRRRARRGRAQRGRDVERRAAANIAERRPRRRGPTATAPIDRRRIDDGAAPMNRAGERSRSRRRRDAGRRCTSAGDRRGSSRRRPSRRRSRRDRRDATASATTSTVSTANSRRRRAEIGEATGAERRRADRRRRPRRPRRSRPSAATKSRSKRPTRASAAPHRPPLQDPGGHQAPADHAGAGHQGGARQQGRGADDLPVARRPLLRADAEHARGGGVSRKITSISDRRRLKDILEDLDIPEGMGVIVRTAGAERSKAEIKRDYEYLLRLWNEIRELTLQSTAPALIYEEGNLIKRSIRDLYTRDIDEVLVEGEEGYQTAKAFMRMLMPSHAKRVQPYRDPQVGLFHRFQVESQIDAIHSPVVQLRSGGYIVINQTEALVAIDVNSGRSTRERNIEETALTHQPRSRRRDRPPAAPARPRRADRHRLHRHGGAPQPGRGRAPAQGGAEERPRAHPGRPDQPVRPAGDVAPAAAAVAGRGLDPALPALRRHRPYPLDRIDGALCAALDRGGRHPAALGRDLRLCADRRSRSTSSTRSASRWPRSRRATASASLVGARRYADPAGLPARAAARLRRRRGAAAAASIQAPTMIEERGRGGRDRGGRDGRSRAAAAEDGGRRPRERRAMTRSAARRRRRRRGRGARRAEEGREPRRPRPEPRGRAADENGGRRRRRAGAERARRGRATPSDDSDGERRRRRRGRRGGRGATGARGRRRATSRMRGRDDRDRAGVARGSSDAAEDDPPPKAWRPRSATIETAEPGAARRRGRVEPVGVPRTGAEPVAHVSRADRSSRATGRRGRERAMPVARSRARASRWNTPPAERSRRRRRPKRRAHHEAPTQRRRADARRGRVHAVDRQSRQSPRRGWWQRLTQP